MNCKSCERTVARALSYLTLMMLTLFASPSFSQGGQPNIPHNIPMPEDAKIIAPSTGESGDVSVFSGAWVGEWYYQRSGFSFKHILVVERIENNTAEVIYATGPTSSETRSSPARWIRLKGKFERGTLIVPISPDINVKYSVTANNELSGMYVIASMTMRSKLERTDIMPTMIRDLVPLPEDMQVLTLESNQNASAPSAGFAGTWSGWWGGSLPHILVVEKLETDRAEVIYAWGQVIPPPVAATSGWRRVTGQISKDMLTLNLPNGAIASYRITDAGALEGTYSRDGRTSRAMLGRASLR